jgi:hypothetical protein
MLTTVNNTRFQIAGRFFAVSFDKLLAPPFASLYFTNSGGVLSRAGALERAGPLKIYGFFKIPQNPMVDNGVRMWYIL